MKTKPKNEGALERAWRRAVQTRAEMRRATATLDRRMKDDGEERFDRIMRKLEEHSRILNHLVQLVEALPDRILEAIGLKTTPK